MKCLFLTSSPGYGHIRAAEAIDAALRCRYPTAETHYVNITQLMDEQVSNAIQDGYLRMTAEQPALYQKLYDLDKQFVGQLSGKIPAEQALVDFLEEQQRKFFPEIFERSRFSLPVSYKSLDSALFNTLVNGVCNRHKIPAGRLLMKSLLGLMYSIMSSRLKKIIKDYEPDCLIATQMYPNALLTRLIEKGAINQPVVGVLTDYGTHGIWARNTTSRYCVSGTKAAAGLQQQGVPATRIRVTGIPLMPAFANIPTQNKARQDLGLAQQPTVLITGGQCGIGVAETVKKLLQDERQDYQILVTAGSNKTEMKTLQQLTQCYPRFRLFSWRNDMCHLLCAADVVVGKPGGLSVSEAMACGKPFIATCSLGGQEMHNVHFLQEQGAGLQVELNTLPDTLNELFNDAPCLARMKRNAYHAGRPHAAREVVAEIESLLRTQAKPQFNHKAVAEL